MNYKEHTRLDLVAGGNVFKQGDHMTLGFTPRDYEGDVVDLTGKDIEGVIYSKSKGIVYTAPAEFITTEQKIEFTIDEALDHGQFQVEFTVTDAADPEYRRKFPSAEQDGRLIIKLSADNMDVVGVQMTTVSQLKNELQGLQNDFAGQVLPRVDTVEGKQTQLETQFTDVVSGVTDDAEILSARTGPDGTYQTIGQRMDATTMQLAETETFTDDLGLSASTNGAVGDGVADDTLALQTLINQSSGRQVNLKTNGVYKISDTINLIAGTKLRGNNATFIVSANVDGVKIAKNTDARDFNVKSGVNNYSKTLLKIDDKSGFNVISTGSISNISLEGDSGYLGTGIGCEDGGVNGVLTYFRATNVSFTKLNHGILLKNTAAGSWYNGNVFTNQNFYDCKNNVTLEGICDGNEFIGLQIQPTPRTVFGIKCGGNNNKFYMTSWDYHAFPNARPYDFKGGSDNKIYTNLSLKNKSDFHNLNSTNNINGFPTSAIVLPKPKERSSVMTRNGSSVSLYENYIGNQDDIMAFANKIYGIQITGKQPATNINNSFSLNTSYTTWNMLANEETTIRIDTTSKPLSYINVLGVLFAYSNFPDRVKIETENAAGTKVVWLDTTTIADPCIYSLQSAQSSVTAIYITFSVTTDKPVRISRIFASSGGNKQRSFVQSDGGEIYGDLSFEDLGKGVVLKSPDGSRFRLSVGNDGIVSAIKI